MQVSFSDRINAFAELGDVLYTLIYKGAEISVHWNSYGEMLEKGIEAQYQLNKWFTPEFSRHALSAIAEMLNRDDLQKMKEKYNADANLDLNQSKDIAVISAGNIPVAAFHDFFSVLASGNRYIGKLSSQDRILLPILANILTNIEPAFKDSISFVDTLPAFDKVIATGSNNSARYFEYYFGKFPHILRKNRNSIAVLSGKETEEELARLSEDVFMYFGLGCRSISKLYVPENYDFGLLVDVFDKNAKVVSSHNHYLNNIDYQKTMRLMNKIPYVDAGALLLEENGQLSSPIGVLHFQYYGNISEVLSYIQRERENIQCVASNMTAIENKVALGSTQHPAIFNFADNKDSITFLATKEKS